MDSENVFGNKINYIRKSKILKVGLFAIMVSFFYNMSFINYSLKGNNELRLYDVFGLVLLFEYVKNYNFLKVYINKKFYFKFLSQFLNWSLFTLIFTALFSFIRDRPIWLVQSILYFYHFFVFFLFTVFASLYAANHKVYRSIVHILLVLIILESILVIAQNIGLVPFLWNYKYKLSYLGFLSGTLGPNKIVLGMTMFMSFCLCIGLFFQKNIKINKTLLSSGLILSGLTVVVSGSRTSYLALIVFLFYLFIFRTRKLIYPLLLLFVVSVIAITLDLEVVEVITNVFDNRIYNKLSDPTILKEGGADVSQLYEDLGSGRKNLSIAYIQYFISNPYIIPFGIGFNNRLLIGFSAHNIYLSLINEVGLVGLFLYFRWLCSYMLINLKKTPYLKSVLNGLIISMLVTLFFGEHLYIYRPLFALVGFFMFIVLLLTSPRFFLKDVPNKPIKR